MEDKSWLDIFLLMGMIFNQGGNMCDCFKCDEVKEDCYWYDEEQDMGARLPWCKLKPYSHGPIEPSDCKDCLHYHSKYKKTNADGVRAMNDEQLSEWFWKMLDYTRGFTDSRIALREWLKAEEKKND